MRYYLQQLIEIMSHQFSFLQVFVGYDSALSQLLTTFRRDYKFEILPVGLRVGCYRLIEIMLQTDMSKFQAQIRQTIIFVQQMSLYCSVLARATLAQKQCNPTATKPELLNNRLIPQLKKVLILPRSYRKYSNICYYYIVIWLCNKLLQKIWFLNKQKASSRKCGLMSHLQLNLECLKYWRVDGNVFYHQSFKFLHAHN